MSIMAAGGSHRAPLRMRSEDRVLARYRAWPSHGTDMSEPDRSNASLSDAPAWRREPFRVLFPLGIALLWAGILHWVLFALQWITRYEPVFHSIVQIQGFLTAFAAGFLLTAIPRRTCTAPPGPVTMAIAIAAPVGTSVLAWFHLWGASQVPWLALVIALTGFALRRFRKAERRPPASFVWVPMSFAIGVLGSALIALYGMHATADFRWHDVGRGLLLQGMFLGLVIGVGGLALPLMTRKEPAPDADPARPGVLLAHVFGALVLIASFALESFVSMRLGYALRAALVLAMLELTARIHRSPSVPGLHRRYMWLAAWLLPIGYTLAAIWPADRQIGLHTAFLGGFAWLTLTIGMHVTLAHGGAGQRLDRASPGVIGFGLCMTLALAGRVAAEVDGLHRLLWIGLSAGLLLLATVFWSARVLPFAWWRA